ncbi:RHS repeat domain-containing protein [Mucilaginibacter psychrotolerans]|nr:RHS repeat domain-containing protein [Mucilaginibacter psychrotolerans]
MKLKLTTRLIFFLLLFFTGHSALAQFSENNAKVPPSPNSAALIKDMDTPVDMYSGKVQITADLYNLKTAKFAIPIGLNYVSSGGIKVQDMAGSTGLGWEFIACGEISRQMNSLPDEQPDGFFGQNAGAHAAATYLYRLDKIVSGDWDEEPDVFYYSFPGYSGKFVFSKEKGAVLINENGVRVINHPWSGQQVPSFILADPDGNNYYFGSSSASIDNTSSKSETFDNNSRVLNFPSTWHLDKIVSADKTETVTVNYETGENYSYKYYKNRSVARYIQSSYSSPLELDGSTARQGAENTYVTIVAPKYISTIVTKSGQASFFYEGRMDLAGGKRLKYFNIRNNLSDPIAKFEFVYSYFLSTPTSSDIEEKRLKLDKILLWDNKNMQSIDYYSFEYNTLQNLPSRKSVQFDHWGFYNSNPYDRSIPGSLIVYQTLANIKIPVGLEPYDPSRDAAIKVPDPVRCQANILTKTINPGGGYSTFEYELNQYAYMSGTSVISNNGGGLRIKKVSSFDGTSTLPSKSVSYSYVDANGKSTGRNLAGLPIYSSMVAETSSFQGLPNIPSSYLPQVPQQSYPNTIVDNVVPPLHENYPQVPGSGAPGSGGLPPIVIPITNFKLNTDVYLAVGQIMVNLFFPSQSVNHPFINLTDISSTSLFDLSGNSVGYDMVTQINMDNSKNVTYFTNNIDYPDFDKSFTMGSDYKPTSLSNPNAPPYSPKTSFSYARGQVKYSLAYNNTGALVKKIFNEYELSPKLDSVRGTKAAIVAFKYSNPIIIHYYNIASYSFMRRNLLLVKSTETDYDLNGLNPLEKITAYTYEPRLFLPKQVTTTNSKAEEEKIEYTYVDDLTPHVFLPGFLGIPQTPLTYMALNNIVSKPIETVYSKKINGVFNVLKADLLTFRPNDNNLFVQPKYAYSLSIDHPVTDYIKYGMQYNSSYETPIIDSRMEVKRNFIKVDNLSGNLMEESVNNIVDPGNASNWINVKSDSYLYGYNSQYLTVKSNNAKVNEIFYDGFEEPDTWFDVVYDKSFSHSGRASARIDNPNACVCEVYSHSKKWLTISLTAPRTYKYSGWIYSNKSGAELVLFMKRAGETGYFSYVDAVSTTVTNSWVFVEKEFLVPADVVLLSLRIDNNGNATGGGSIWFDDIRLHPAEAMMTTFTYKPLVGLTSVTDQSGRTTTYEYDNFNRLSFIKDLNGNIIKAFCYNYRGQQTNCFSTNNGPTATVYARIEVLNQTYNSSYTDADNYYEQTTAEIYIAFYSDDQCTQPYILTSNIDPIVSSNNSYTYGYGGGGFTTGYGSYHISAGVNRYFLGNQIITSANTYTDPRTGTGHITDTSTLTFWLTGDNYTYTALPTFN